MNKLDFLDALRVKLSDLPESDREERLAFYGEMIDDQIEDGLTEEDAVAAIGTVDDVAAQIHAETPLLAIVKEKITPKRSLRTWEIVLLGLGAPRWVPLLISTLAVVLSVYIVMWAVVLSLYAADLALAISALGCAAITVVWLLTGNPLGAGCALGATLVCAGLTILLFWGCAFATKGIVALTRILRARRRKR